MGLRQAGLSGWVRHCSCGGSGVRSGGDQVPRHGGRHQLQPGGLRRHQADGQPDQGGVRPRAPAAEHGVPPGQLQVQGRHPPQVRQVGGADGPVPRQEVRLLGAVRHRGGSRQVVRPRCHQVQRQGCGDQLRSQHLRRGVRARGFDRRRGAEPGPVAGELGGLQQEGQPRRRRRRRRGGVRPARPHGLRARLAGGGGGGTEHQGQVRPELDASPDAPSGPASPPHAALQPQAPPIHGQRRSGDRGRPVADGRRRRRGRALASASAPPVPAAAAAASAAAAEAARLGQRCARHELAAASAAAAPPGGAAAEQRCRRRRSSCSIITIPTLHRRAGAELAPEERLPLPGPTHLARQRGHQDQLHRPSSMAKIDRQVCVFH